MANWCSTSYIVKGIQKDVEKLYGMMKTLEELDKPYTDNGWGHRWLGCLVSRLGHDPNDVHCRGEWSDLDLFEYDDGTELHFNTETAWSRCDEVENIIYKHFPMLSIYYYEEEPGMEIYNTNDLTGEVFPEDYILDIEYDGMDYYTEGEARKRLESIFNTKFSNIDAAIRHADRYNDDLDQNGKDGHVWIHKINREI